MSTKGRYHYGCDVFRMIDAKTAFSTKVEYSDEYIEAA